MISMSFYKQLSSKTEVLEICVMAGMEASRQRSFCGEGGIAWSEDALGQLGDSFPFWIAFGRGSTASLGTKEPDGHH